ncbi:hypothetical protein [Nocardia niigatensis]|uniref:hypothetical protein n=1 Tax=Nocardia niigatensis TaxID=209249 RepID=UPI0003118444|nr:hypothetical protein [Nocardia niigatensis]
MALPARRRSLIGRNAGCRADPDAPLADLVDTAMRGLRPALKSLLAGPATPPWDPRAKRV